MATEYKDLPLLSFETQSSWIAWLEAQHRSNHEAARTAPGVWIKFSKKGSNIASLTYEEAREAAIMYGWIDGLKNRFNDSWYLLRFTPRRPRSKWSMINREIAKQLIADKKMCRSGLEVVDAAKADGRWDAAYEPQSKIQPHPKWVEALRSSPKAMAFFETISKANRYSILQQIRDAKRDTTRARRIEKFMAMLESKSVPNPNR